MRLDTRRQLEMIPGHDDVFQRLPEAGNQGRFRDLGRFFDQQKIESDLGEELLMDGRTSHSHRRNPIRRNDLDRSGLLKLLLFHRGNLEFTESLHKLSSSRVALPLEEELRGGFNCEIVLIESL
jgi:hypothetical protein